MAQLRDLIWRIPVPRASDNGSSGQPDDAETIAPRSRQTLTFTAAQALYLSDAAIEALPLDQRIELVDLITKELGRPGSEIEHDRRPMAQATLASVMRTLKCSTDFDRLFHSVDSRSLLLHAPKPKDIRKQFEANLKATKPGDWQGYSRYLDVVTNTRPTTGNAIEFMAEGVEMMQRLTDDIRGAKDSIDIVMYKWVPDEVGLALAQELIKKARPLEGSQEPVAVRVMLDRQGTFASDPQGAQRMVDMMREAGIEVIVKSTSVLRSHLDHRKVVVIDGKVGFTGGMNIGLEYRDQWRDQLSRIEGPLVNQLRINLRDRWHQEGGLLQADDARLVAEPAMEGPKQARVVAHAGKFDDSYIKAAYLKAIYSAEREINIANPYFTDQDIEDALIAAAKRGVTVRVMVPEQNDVQILRDAARAGYPKLIAAGVEIYEYQGRMAHQKIATIDGLWSTFGSSNLDARSLEYNDELNVVSLDPLVAQDINEKMFNRDLARSKRITSYRVKPFERLLRAFSHLM